MAQTKNNYSLIEKEIEYRTYNEYSYYFINDKLKEKQFKPIDLNGVRYKLDLKTGEYRNYLRKEVAQSIQQSVSHSQKLLHMLVEMNDFDWFLTFTFDPKRVKNRYDPVEILNHYKKFIDNIQKQFPSISYVTVYEKHEDGAIHFHMLCGGVTWKDLGFVYSGRVCCSWAYKKNYACSERYFEKTKHLHELKQTDGIKIYNVTKFIYGITTATKIANRQACNYYVTKYLDKALGSTGIFQKRFYYSKNLRVPNVIKREIGPDFEKPVKITCVPGVIFNKAYKDAFNSYYNDEFNVLTCRTKKQENKDNFHIWGNQTDVFGTKPHYPEPEQISDWELPF